MIRDHLMVGICDKAISEKQQLEADLTLERAKVTHGSLTGHEQQQVLNGAVSPSVTTTPDALDEIHTQRGAINK